MVLQDFCFLKDIGNQLETVDVQLVVIMMGQDPEFEKTIEELRRRRRLDLVSRFTLRRLWFRALQKREDFANLLQLIDQQFYPLDSDCPWPKYFAPRAWESGFRMLGQLNELMTALSDVIPGGLAANGVSARQFFLAVRRFLLDLAELDSQGIAVEPGIWRRCIDYALIEDAALIAKSGRNQSVGIRI